jgi:hypothetical protein
LHAVRAALAPLLRALCAACLVLAAGAAAAAAEAPTPAPGPLWSAPAQLAPCAARAPLRVVFPSDSPTHATGAGAVVWANGARCAGGEGTRIAAVGAGDVPSGPGGEGASAGRRGVPPVLALRGAIAAGAPHGQVVLAGLSSQRGAAQLIEGVAGSPLSALGVGDDAQAPLALTSAYLGDVAFAAAGPGASGGLRVRIERYFARAYGPWVTVVRGGAVSAPTLALDYRTDLLVVWEQAGALLARDLPASGAPAPVQRLGAAGADVRVSALRSDDNRAIVAWSERRGATTSVYMDQSATAVRFGPPRLLERVRDADGLPAPAASPTLVRLRSEGVMLAWAGAQHGRWALRLAPIDQHGLRSIATLAAPGADALLAGLAPGPDGGALALWSQPAPRPDGAPDVHAQALLAAPASDSYPGLTRLGAPETLASPGPVEDAAVAFDPGSGRALAVWRAGSRGLSYAIRTRGGGD